MYQRCRDWSLRRAATDVISCLPKEIISEFNNYLLAVDKIYLIKQMCNYWKKNWESSQS